MSGEALTAPPALRDAANEGDYRVWIAFLKPRVLTLVVFTALVGLLVAPGHLNPLLQATALICTTVAAGACGAINMWWDRDIDAVMRRTRKRPIPAGMVKPADALTYGIALAVGSAMIMGLAVNAAAAAILAFSVFFYVVIYTMWLKRSTPQNIVIGGAAGAFPPLIGWAAVTGSIDVMPVIMFLIIFVWTPPHFWSLALWANEDYTHADVPMLPVVSGERGTRRQIFAYTLVLVPLTLAPVLVGFSGAIYGVTAAALGLLFLWRAYQVLTDRQDAQGTSLTNDAPAKKAFRYSISYLFVLFGALAADRLILS